jgi:hypothetical protein
MKSRRMRWAGHLSCMGGIINAYRILVGKPKRKRPLVRLWHRWEVIIKMYLKEIHYESVDLIHLAQDRVQLQALVNIVMNLQVE